MSDFSQSELAAGFVPAGPKGRPKMTEASQAEKVREKLDAMTAASKKAQKVGNLSVFYVPITFSNRIGNEEVGFVKPVEKWLADNAGWVMVKGGKGSTAIRFEKSTGRK